MTLTLAQDHLNDTLRGLRDYLRVGGSLLTAVLVFLVIVGVVALTYFLTRHQRRTQSPSVPNDPHLLFENLLRGLQLSAAQRTLLRTFAHESQPDQPALLLVSARLFDHHVTACGPSLASSGDSQAIARIRDVLFPPERGS